MIRSLSTCALLVAFGSFGCASRHEQGVKSDFRTQWTDVNADTKVTTEAAREVLEARDLKNVTANSTAVDGIAKGTMANDTKVKVDIKKQDKMTSQVSVTVGTLGDPKLGADIAKDVKMRAEAK